MTSMFALAGPTASISSHFVSPPLAPLGWRPRSSSLSSVSATADAMWEAHSSVFRRLSFAVMRGVAERYVGQKLPTFGC